MKRIICLILSVLMLFLTGCAANSSNSSSDSIGGSDSGSDTSETTHAPSNTLESDKDEKDETKKPSSSEDKETAPAVDPSTIITTSADGKYRVKELIPDASFANGMTVRSQKDHSNNDSWSNLGKFTYGKTATPNWILSQWDSGPCIWSNRVSGGSAYTLTDGRSKWVTYNPAEKSLLLRLNTDAYYNGNGAVQGDYWPHLLVEQDFPYNSATADEKLFYSGVADKWNLSFDLRMPNYSFTNHGGWVNAAQLYIYFGLRQKSTDRFIWFGVQLFDSRFKNDNDVHYAVDGGKGDATGNMIYCVGMKDLYNGKSGFWGTSSPQVTNSYIHFEIDMIPHLKNMISRGISEQNLPAGTTADDFYISYMNYGWEIIGTYDCGVEIKNLSMQSYVEK